MIFSLFKRRPAEQSYSGTDPAVAMALQGGPRPPLQTMPVRKAPRYPDTVTDLSPKPVAFINHK